MRPIYRVMLKALLILMTGSTLTFGMPVLSDYWYGPRTFFVPFTPLAQPQSSSTLFANAPAPRAAENPPPENPPAETPPPPPEFVMPTSGAGWVDFVFAHMLSGVGDEEAGLIRSVLTPQYDTFARQMTPAAAAPVESAPESVIVAPLTISPTPLRLLRPLPASPTPPPPSGSSGTLELLVVTPPSNPFITPEPSSLALVGLGVAGLAWLRRRG